jgi:DNA-directed RNA polymerase subunit RPC12/RpoP
VSPLEAEAARLVSEATSRAAQKSLGRLLDADPRLHEAVVALARSRGVELPDDARDWPGKRLLRRAQNRSDASRERGNPIALDEAFVCRSCGRHVPAHGRSARDHCPFCLAGSHVDDRVPGDRASPCGGLLVPVAVEQRNGRWMLLYRCQACGVRRANQVLMDGDPPDDWAKVCALAGRET